MAPLTIVGAMVAHQRMVAALVAAFAGLLAAFTGIGQGAELGLRDLRDAFRSESASGEIHIVEIDARSIAAIARWPWPRSVHAAAVDRLREAGVRSIAFDVDLSSASAPAEDARLAEALRRAGGAVILPTFRQDAGAGSHESLESAPIPALADHSFLAAANVVPDADGYLRQMPFGLETMGLPRPSLAALVAESAGQSGRLFAIDYAIDPDSIPRHAMVDLIEGRVDPALLRGKRIVIGATAVELGDRYPVPRHGLLPGVVIQAMAAETLMHRKPAQPLGPWPALALVLAAIGWAAGRRSLAGRACWFGALALLLVALPLAAELWTAWTLAVVPALAALLCGGAAAGAAALGQRYREGSLTDAATGLPNLAALEAAVAGPVRIVVARIDQFAGLAAGLGPELSAKLVRQVADRLRCGGSADNVYRLDEGSLGWIEPAATDLDTVAARSAALLRLPVDCGRRVTVSLHLGAADGDGASARQLVANALLAADRAAASRTRWQLFTTADASEADRSVTLLADFDSALAQGRIWNAYQPQLDLASGRIVAVEALVRWSHPTLGPLAPDAFIPLLERRGRIMELTLQVMERGIADALDWLRIGRDLGLAVNVSAMLLSDGAFIRAARELLERTGIDPASLTLEITETAAMADPAAAVAALEEWRALGLKLSIDDYGTGQSSLSYLQMLPATEIKIDKSFVAPMAHDQRNAVMVRSTIAMAHELGLSVVAEGVEDEQCLALLRTMGCDVAQGYLIGRPAACEAILTFLSERVPYPAPESRLARR
ncbi:MAG TPA: EAL domain-containing protein [Allosphingosinicella sp.]